MARQPARAYYNQGLVGVTFRVPKPGKVLSYNVATKMFKVLMQVRTPVELNLSRDDVLKLINDSRAPPPDAPRVTDHVLVGTKVAQTFGRESVPGVVRQYLPAPHNVFEVRFANGVMDYVKEYVVRESMGDVVDLTLGDESDADDAAEPSPSPPPAAAPLTQRVVVEPVDVISIDSDDSDDDDHGPRPSPRAVIATSHRRRQVIEDSDNDDDREPFSHLTMHAASTPKRADQSQKEPTPQTKTTTRPSPASLLLTSDEEDMETQTPPVPRQPKRMPPMNGKAKKRPLPLPPPLSSDDDDDANAPDAEDGTSSSDDDDGRVEVVFNAFSYASDDEDAAKRTRRRRHRERTLIPPPPVRKKMVAKAAISPLASAVSMDDIDSFACCGGHTYDDHNHTTPPVVADAAPSSWRKYKAPRVTDERDFEPSTSHGPKRTKEQEEYIRKRRQHLQDRERRAKLEADAAAAGAAKVAARMDAKRRRADEKAEAAAREKRRAAEEHIARRRLHEEQKKEKERSRRSKQPAAAAPSNRVPEDLEMPRYLPRMSTAAGPRRLSTSDEYDNDDESVARESVWC
ncbi:Aste57867_22696 [Aphanomyces stellatus]|uniref:Aste57867_22696 protein n=1 Tax=Aphanomyces stellatus TaxID=120398 RepID=A0A485LLY1_9STRA|nr:hypothetical protein As57867_022626 [Aphanomyces stellatus]VFT99350.1 Aste57867_22696 [Aphanomyces stellatus]